MPRWGAAGVAVFRRFGQFIACARCCFFTATLVTMLFRGRRTLDFLRPSIEDWQLAYVGYTEFVGLESASVASNLSLSLASDI